MKTVYYTYDTLQSNGTYIAAMIVPDDFEAKYPITDTPIPEALQVTGAAPRYKWELAQWEDASADAKEAADVKRDQDLAALKAQNATLTQTVAGLRTELTEAQGAVVELAQMTLPSTDPDTTATPVADTQEVA